MDQLRSPPRPTASRVSHARPRRRSSNNSPPVNPDPGSSHTSKRRRTSRSTATAAASSPISPPSLPHDEPTPELEVEEPVDLTAGDEPAALAKALTKQREDAVMAQRAAEHESREGGTALRAYKCPVCMDTPVDATSTVCGHLFCHQCIVDTLKFGEERRTDASGKSRGTCPVCRKPLTRADTPGIKRNLVPLQMKMKTRKRKEGATDL